MKRLAQLIIKLLGQANARELMEWLYYLLNKEDVTQVEHYRDKYFERVVR